MGKRKQPFYRIVVIDSRRSRDGKYIETVGHYNPKDKNLVINKERVEYWLSKGAQSSNTAGRLWKTFIKNTSEDLGPASLSVSSETSKSDDAENRIPPEAGKTKSLRRRKK